MYFLFIYNQLVCYLIPRQVVERTMSPQIAFSFPLKMVPSTKKIAQLTRHISYLVIGWM